jgi:hypothetical protein
MIDRHLAADLDHAIGQCADQQRPGIDSTGQPVGGDDLRRPDVPADTEVVVEERLQKKPEEAGRRACQGREVPPNDDKLLASAPARIGPSR